jgi:succinyl-diaminopimelate desuccinylase
MVRRGEMHLSDGCRGSLVTGSDAIEFLKQMVRIPSVNPPGNEYPAAVQVKRLLDKHGIMNKFVYLDEGRASLVASWHGESSDLNRKVLAFSGHLDVVPPGKLPWKYDPFSAHEEDGRIFGRGTSDMKGGLVAVVFAVIELKQAGIALPGDIKLLLTAGEEVHALGARQLTDLGHVHDVSALVIAEPTRDEVVVAHKGALWIEVTSRGKTAHGATPYLGVNAIVNMHYVIHALLDQMQFGDIRHDLLGAPTYNISRR